ncbi:MAG: hypothetical protein C0434_08035 [Xanthomonadaceae bacterium]|nr:hypothetical protein [Xanthomonadaceae bacterium]
MAALPIQGGSTYPNVSLAANGDIIPTLWSQRCTVKHYGSVIAPEICNNDWEGEIKSMGQRIVIPRTPTVTVIDGNKDVDLDTAGLYNTPTTPASELEINQREIYGFAIEDVDAFQTNTNYLDRLAEDAVKQTAIRQDTKILAGIATRIAATNRGAANGLGGTGAPVTISATNALNFLMRMKRILKQQGVSQYGLKCVVGPKFAQILKNTDLKSALVTGDDVGVIRNGRLGEIDGLMLYESIYLPQFTEGANTAEYVYVIHPDGLTWAMQYSLPEYIRLQNKFKSGIRGQLLWGYNVVEPTYLAAGYVIYDANSL